AVSAARSASGGRAPAGASACGRGLLGAFAVSALAALGWAQCALGARAAGFRDFPIPTARSQPSAIVADPAGNVWFTELSANKIGRITPSGAISEFPLPTTEAGPYAMTAGSRGTLWFTELSANKIGRITPSGAISELPIPTAGGLPYGITAGP